MPLKSGLTVVQRWRLLVMLDLHDLLLHFLSVSVVWNSLPPTLRDYSPSLTKHFQAASFYAVCFVYVDVNCEAQ